MIFDRINLVPDDASKIDVKLDISPELKELIEKARKFINKQAENVDELDHTLGMTVRDSFDGPLSRAVHDAEQCSEMRMNSLAVSKIDEELSLTRMKRDWGDQPKDGLAHYERVCRRNALDGFLAAGLQENDANELVSGIFSSSVKKTRSSQN